MLYPDPNTVVDAVDKPRKQARVDGFAQRVANVACLYTRVQYFGDTQAQNTKIHILPTRK